MRLTRFDGRTAAACPVIALLTVSLIVNFRNTRELRDDSRWVAHSRMVQDTLEEVNSHLHRAEAIQRTHIIVGGDEIPSTFTQSVNAARQAAANARSQTADNPEQQQRLLKLENRIDELSEIWTDTMAVRQEQGLEAAAAVVQDGGSDQSMAALQDELRIADSEERALLDARLGAAQRTYKLAQTAGLLAGAASIAGVLAFLLLMRQRLTEQRRAARTIAEYGERLRTTLASIGDAVISTDNAGCVTNLNGIAESLTGWSKSEAFGRPLEDVFKIINEQSRQPVSNPAIRALKEGTVVGLENHTLLIAKDGTERPIDDSAAPIRCKDGEIVGSVLVFRDITQRRAMERDLEDQLTGARLLASIVESSEDAIISKSPTGTIQTWNASAERLFGYPAAEAIGRPISLIIPEERLGEEVEIIAALRDGRRVDHFETERRRKDGTLIWVSLTISPIVDDTGEFIGASKIARDVTREREAAERERRLLKEAASANMKFRAYFDQGAIFAGLTDLDGKVLEANRLCVEGCGYSRDDVIGRPFYSGPWWTQSPELSDRVREACRMAATGEMFRGELPYFVADGSLRTADLIIVPVKDEDGDVQFLAPIGTDITERKQFETDCQQFATVVENSTDFIGMWDLEGVPFYINPAGLDMVGLEGVDEAKKVRLMDFFFAEDRPQLEAEFFPTVIAEGHGAIEIRFRNFQTDAHRWIAYKVFPLTNRENERVGLATVSQDITERRKMEDDLRALATDLSEADRRKDEFLALLSHELRNPLAPLRNGLQILRLSDDADSRLQARRLMERQLEQLIRLVDDLLDVSRITRGKMELRKSPVRLAEIIQSAVETVRPVIDDMDHQLSIDIPEEEVTVNADLTRLAQVFSNLLNNAAKYTDRGGELSISAVRREREVEVAVCDSGIGIAPDQLSNIFDMFSQADHSLERSQGGLGIGLTLVKRLTEMHGGQVAVASAGVGQGSTFTVRLPVCEEAVPISREPTDSPPGSAMRILVVDDNRDGANTLAILLGVQRHETRTAFDGEQAIAIAEEFRPDVILLDIGLPKLNGYEACRKIRQEDWGKDICLVAVTGWGQDTDRHRSQEAGFDHHLVKPVDTNALMDLLAQVPTQSA